MGEHNDASILEVIVKSIVNHPDEVKVVRSTDELGVLLSLSVNPEDMGLVIGRAGSTAKAIRTLCRIVGMRNNARVNIRIEEPEGSTHVRDRNENRPGRDRSLDDVVDGI